LMCAHGEPSVMLPLADWRFVAAAGDGPASFGELSRDFGTADEGEDAGLALLAGKGGLGGDGDGSGLATGDNFTCDHGEVMRS
jgi:hypothetical protein